MPQIQVVESQSDPSMVHTMYICAASDVGGLARLLRVLGAFQILPFAILSAMGCANPVVLGTWADRG